MDNDKLVSRRRFMGVAVAAMGAVVLTGCSSSQSSSSAALPSSAHSSISSAGVESADESGKAVVVYFSQTGNTAAVAQHIADHLEIDAIELKAAEPYTSEDLDYNDSSTRATVEQNTPETRPGIAELPNLDAYDTVFLGYPIWWGKAPRIMCTFAENCDLSGKTVIPFCTSGSSDIGSSPDELADLASESAIWLEGKRFAAGADGSEIAQWVDSLAS